MLFFEFSHLYTCAQIERLHLAVLRKGFAGEMFSDKTYKGLREAGKDWGEERQGEKAWFHGECWPTAPGPSAAL